MIIIVWKVSRIYYYSYEYIKTEARIQRKGSGTYSSIDQHVDVFFIYIE